MRKIREVAERPTIDERVKRLGTRAPVDPGIDLVDMVRDARDSK